jgi:hypothetical protein
MNDKKIPQDECWECGAMDKPLQSIVGLPHCPACLGAKRRQAREDYEEDRRKEKRGNNDTD